jgi:hypothetical protein
MHVHAVQWYGGFGEIEYRQVVTASGFMKPGNARFDDPEKFRASLDAWERAGAPRVEDVVVTQDEPDAGTPAAAPEAAAP